MNLLRIVCPLLTLPKEKSCEHYDRKHKIIAKCCGKIVNCRFCHDDNSDHKMDRFSTTSVMCSECFLIQDVSNECVGCGIHFAKNYCGICRAWSDDMIFHCNDCGVCRKGDRTNYHHCKVCDLCVSNDHKCKGYLCEETDCFVCLEPLKYSIRNIVGLECSHYVHKECFTSMLNHNRFSCGLCRKTAIQMDGIWSKMS